MQSRTLAELRQEVYRILDEPATDGSPDQSSPRWPAAKVTGYINEGLADFAEESGHFRRRHVIKVRQYQASYNLPSDLLEVLSVEYDREVIYPVTAFELDEAVRDWRSETGTPAYWMVDDQDPDRIRLWPSPDTDGSDFGSDQSDGTIRRATSGTNQFSFDQDDGVIKRMTPSASGSFEIHGRFGIIRYLMPASDNLRVTFTYCPERLVGDDDKPPRPLDRSTALYYWAAFRCRSEGGDKKDLQEAAGWRRLYEAEMARLGFRKRPRGRQHQMKRFAQRRRRGRARMPSDFPRIR